MNKHQIHYHLTNQDLQKQINEIVSCFNFEKVYKVMNFLEWTWWSSSTETKVPSIGELVLQAQRSLEEAAYNLLYTSSKDYCVSTGGFHVQGYCCDDGYIVLDLKFVVAEWDNRE